VLLAGCGVAGDSTSTKEGKQSGGTLHVLKADPSPSPKGQRFPSSSKRRSRRPRAGRGPRRGQARPRMSGSERKCCAGGHRGPRPRHRSRSVGPCQGERSPRLRLRHARPQGQGDSIGTKPVDITAANSHKRDAVIIGGGAGAGAIIAPSPKAGRVPPSGPDRRGDRHRRGADHQRQRSQAGQWHPCHGQAHPRDASLSGRAISLGREK